MSWMRFFALRSSSRSCSLLLLQSLAPFHTPISECSFSSNLEHQFKFTLLTLSLTSNRSRPMPNCWTMPPNWSLLRCVGCCCWTCCCGCCCCCPMSAQMSRRASNSCTRFCAASTWTLLPRMMHRPAYWALTFSLST